MLLVKIKEKEEEHDLAKHERSEMCPNCKNKTLLINDFFKYNTCININCCYFERRKNYIDAITYSW